jgi:putative hemolysin
MNELVVVVVCIAMNGLLSCMEMAFVSANRPRLRQLAAQGNTDAACVLELRANPERTLSVLQVGITALGAFAAAVSGVGMQESVTPRLESALRIEPELAEGLALALLVGPFTYVTVLIGELVPKSLALRRATSIAMRSARWLLLLDRILAPVVWLLEISTRWTLHNVLRVRRTADPRPQRGTSSSVDLDKLSTPHRQYVANLLGIERKRVEEIALSWDDVAWLSADQPAADVERLVLTSGHTRLPVLRDGEIVGLLHTKEFSALRAYGAEDWSPLVRPIVHIDAKATLLAALRALQSARSHMAVVRSGSTPIGIVTLEDVFEEVVGDIRDEDDDGLVQRLRVRRPWQRG